MLGGVASMDASARAGGGLVGGLGGGLERISPPISRDHAWAPALWRAAGDMPAAARGDVAEAAKRLGDDLDVRVDGSDQTNERSSAERRGT